MKTLNCHLIKLTIAIVLGLNLSGCIFVAGAAAGAAAIGMVYDHRTIQHVLEDTNLANQIINRHRRYDELTTNCHLEVAVFNRVVLLAGQCPSPNLRILAENLARQSHDIKTIYNQISIQGPTSTLTRTSDTWITTKIKGNMLATEDLKSSSIKVVTENGIVYLMGNVTRSQADIAVGIAREISGVQKVVKIFNYDVAG